MSWLWQGSHSSGQLLHLLAPCHCAVKYAFQKKSHLSGCLGSTDKELFPFWTALNKPSSVFHAHRHPEIFRILFVIAFLQLIFSQMQLLLMTRSFHFKQRSPAFRYKWDSLQAQKARAGAVHGWNPRAHTFLQQKKNLWDKASSRYISVCLNSQPQIAAWSSCTIILYPSDRTIWTLMPSLWKVIRVGDKLLCCSDSWLLSSC